MQFRGGIQELMKQAAWLQRKVEEAQKSNKERTITAEGANGKVKVTVTLGREVTRIEVDPELLSNDSELALDAVTGTVNAALKMAGETMDQEVQKATGGLKIPRNHLIERARMDEGNDPITDLVRLLVRLPGVGEKSARRIAFYMLACDPEYAHSLGQGLATLSARVRQCASCGAYTSRDLCTICEDPRRARDVLCVVARPMDADAIERARVFSGRYHVLHALLDPLGGIGPGEFPLARLLERVRVDEVKEVILATPPTVEGEATSLYLAESLRGAGVSTSRIASGVPHGGDLEFVDPITLGRAMEGRRAL